MNQLEAPFSALMSYHYFGSTAGRALVHRLAQAGGQVIGDSGAFSAMTKGASIDLGDYAGWVAELGPSLSWAASLDVIGDPEASWANWIALRELGATTVPTIHLGAPMEALDRYVGAGARLVGLGGMAHRKDTDVALRWLVKVFRHARDHHPDVRFHGWGLTRALYLDHLPFWSVDSSSFGSGYRYGRASVWDPETSKPRQVDLDGSTPGRWGRLLREQYGVTPRDIAKSHAANRSLVAGLASLSCQAMEAHYRARHQVTPPVGWEERGAGTFVHYADSSDATFKHLSDHLTTHQSEVRT